MSNKRVKGHYKAGRRGGAGEYFTSRMGGCWSLAKVYAWLLNRSYINTPTRSRVTGENSRTVARVECRGGIAAQHPKKSPANAKGPSLVLLSTHDVLLLSLCYPIAHRLLCHSHPTGPDSRYQNIQILGAMKQEAPRVSLWTPFSLILSISPAAQILRMPASPACSILCAPSPQLVYIQLVSCQLLLSHGGPVKTDGPCRGPPYRSIYTYT